MIEGPGQQIEERTGLDQGRLATLRAVDRACRRGRHRPKTAPTTRAVAQLVPDGLSPAEARARLSALGQPWRTLHPLLVHVGNWGSAYGDEPVDDEYTRVGLSPLGHLALDAAAGRCGPVPLGLVLGDVHPRRPRTDDPWATPASQLQAAQRPGFGLGPILDALQSARSGHAHPSQLLPVPSSPSGAVVDVDLLALVSGEPVHARLGCRFEVLPAPAQPPASPGPPPEVVADALARGLTSFGWVNYEPRQYAGPSLLITGTPTGMDTGLLEDQLRDAAFGDERRRPPVHVPGVADESTDKVGTRLLVHTDDPAADLHALRSWITTLPAATEEVTWLLHGGADVALRHWLQSSRRTAPDCSGLPRCVREARRQHQGLGAAGPYSRACHQWRDQPRRESAQGRQPPSPSLW